MFPWSEGFKETGEDHIRKLPSASPLHGKTVLITGCTSGIGIETARCLAKTGATVFITGRNRSKLEAVQADLLAEINKDQTHSGDSGSSGNDEERKDHHSRIRMLVMDLSSLSSVRNAVNDFLSQSSSLHILICNAACMSINNKLTAEGLDIQFATNHVGHFLLFQLVKDRMLSSTPSRLVVVSSDAHQYYATPSKGIDYSRLPAGSDKDFVPLKSHGMSKLANVLFVMEVHRLYGKKGLTSYVLHPGFFRSGIQTDFYNQYLSFRIGTWLLSPLQKTIQQGAATSVYCAITPGIEKYSGQYFQNSRVTNRIELDKIPEDEPEKLWTWTEEFIAKHTSPAGGEQQQADTTATAAAK